MLDLIAPLFMLSAMTLADYLVPGVAFTYGVRLFPFGERDREKIIIENYRSGMRLRIVPIFAACTLIYLDELLNIGSLSGLAVVFLLTFWMALSIRDIFATNRA